MTGRIRRDWTGRIGQAGSGLEFDKGAKSGLGIKRLEIEDQGKKRMSEIAKEPGYSQVYGVLEYSTCSKQTKVGEVLEATGYTRERE
jgi:hypothetical protein